MYILFVLLLLFLFLLLFLVIGIVLFFIRMIGGFANLGKVFSFFRRKQQATPNEGFSSAQKKSSKRGRPVFDKSSAQEVEFEDVEQ